MNSIEEVTQICEDRLVDFNDPKYKARLEAEIEDLEKWKKEKGEDKALMLLGRRSDGKTGPNKSNSVIVFLMGLSESDPIKNGSGRKLVELTSGSCPDIDNDFDPRFRDSVKRQIVNMFGDKHVCSIGNYGTYKTKTCILDVARTLGYDVGEAVQITKKIDPLQTIEGPDGEESKFDDMSFDDLCSHFPDLRAYLEKYPEIRRHAEVLRNQIKSMGMHAGGVIISSVDLKDKIPVQYDKPAADDRKVVSAWAESPGKSEELSSIGLVKFDILGLANLANIATCIELIEKHRGIKLEKEDVPINDSRAIRMSSKDDLVGIFQMENKSTKSVADNIVLESLNDVAALTSLIRPGPRIMGMEREYAERKHGAPYTIPEFLQPVLAETYGVITYQEQCQKVSQLLGGLTPSESYKFLKAMAKKNTVLMASFKTQFMEGAKPRIESGEITEAGVVEMWDLMEKFAEYAFNKCLTPDHVVMTSEGLKLLSEVVVGDEVLCPSGGKDVFSEVLDVIDQGEKEVFEFTFGSGNKIRCTPDHKVLTEEGVMAISDAISLGLGVGMEFDS